MVRPIIPQPITDMGYKGMDFLQKFKGKLGENKAPISQGGIIYAKCRGINSDEWYY